MSSRPVVGLAAAGIMCFWFGEHASNAGEKDGISARAVFEAMANPTPDQIAKFATNEISAKSCRIQAERAVRDLGDKAISDGTSLNTLRLGSRNLCLVIEQDFY